MIRPGAPKDLQRIVDLGIEGLSRNPVDELLVSREKCTNITKEILSAATHFAWVSEIDGEVQGALMAYVSPMIAHERSEATIIMLYSRTGEGMQLLAEFVNWFMARPVLKMASFTGTGDEELDRRICRVLKHRYDFRDSVPFLHKVK